MWEEISPRLTKLSNACKIKSQARIFLKDRSDCCCRKSLRIRRIGSEGWGRISSHIRPVSCEQVQQSAFSIGQWVYFLFRKKHVYRRNNGTWSVVRHI